MVNGGWWLMIMNEQMVVVNDGCWCLVVVGSGFLMISVDDGE